VFQSLFGTDSFESALVEVVNRGGDADTTGSILGMVAGALYGVGPIPKRWISSLDEKVTAAALTQVQELLCRSPVWQGSVPALLDSHGRSPG
jgi:ADP-ribosyl-[dinitrogen reductase] hydrolase